MNPQTQFLFCRKNTLLLFEKDAATKTNNKNMTRSNFILNWDLKNYFKILQKNCLKTNQRIKNACFYKALTTKYFKIKNKKRNLVWQNELHQQINPQLTTKDFC